MPFWRGVARAERWKIDRQKPCDQSGGIEGDYYGSGMSLRKEGRAGRTSSKARGVGAGVVAVVASRLYGETCDGMIGGRVEL